MSARRPAEKYGVTPGKLVLIGVLTVVLALVVYRNFLRDSSGGQAEAASGAAPAASSSANRTATPVHRAVPTPETPQNRDVPRRTWPRFELAETINHDPFALPELFPRPATTRAAVLAEAGPADSPASEASGDERAAELAALQQLGVQLIMQNGREYIARIGDRQVRVGDKIGGFRVVNISFRDGVELELEGDASP